MNLCELNISNKVECVCAPLEKCWTRKGKKYDPKNNAGCSMTSSSVASTASDMSNVLVSVRPISIPTQSNKLKPNLEQFYCQNSERFFS